jgi:dephospho-CoA kinase
VKKIGLTGGIGSGKSTVASVFSALDVPVYDSDARAKQLYYTPEVKKQVMDLLGTESYTDDNGSLNKDWVARQVFSDPDRLARLNALIHPLVAKDFSDWCSRHRACTYVLKEAAILIESGAHKGLDALIVVEADHTARLKRISERDNMNIQKAEARIEQQMSDEERRSHADHIIVNDGSSDLILQVIKVHRSLLQLD